MNEIIFYLIGVTDGVLLVFLMLLYGLNHSMENAMRKAEEYTEAHIKQLEGLTDGIHKNNNKR